MYIIERYYWKLNEKATPFEEEKDKRYLLNKDSDRNLRFDDEVKRPHYGCEELWADDDYQSTLNVQQRWGPTYCLVKNDTAQEMKFSIKDFSSKCDQILCSVNISNNFMMVLHTGYLFFVAVEGYRFVIVWKQKTCSCIIQKLCKGIHRQLFDYSKTN